MKLLPRLIIAFVICFLAVPAITSPVHATAAIELSQDEGYVGDEIEVSGEAFHADETVYIYYDDELQTTEEVEWGNKCPHGLFTIYITIPESCQGYHDIFATEKGEPVRSGMAKFTVKSRLSLVESSGHVGDSIKVKGSGFPSEGTDIKLRYYLDTDSHCERDSSPHIDFPVAEVNSFGSWEQTFSVPASVKGAHSIDAYYNDDESTLSEVNNDEARFEVQPTIILNPDSGCVGDTIAVSGSGFARSESDIKLRFDGSKELATGDADEDGEWGPLNLTIPSCERGSHTIEAFHGNSTSAIASATFTIASDISLNPDSGHAGQSFSVTGSAFTPNVVVKISYQDQTASTATDADGNFSAVTFTATGEHGEQQVTATHNGDSAHPATFYMEETPPGKPELSSPIDSKRAGFFSSFTGKIRPKFKWHNIPDASGIASYDLQISTSPDFATPVVSLSISSKNPGSSDDTVAYTLPQKHALSHGSYYWRVKATDAAANEGGWSEAQSFRAGWLPRWAMFASAAGLLFLIMIISLIIRRKRSYYYY